MKPACGAILWVAGLSLLISLISGCGSGLSDNGFESGTVMMKGVRPDGSGSFELSVYPLHQVKQLSPLKGAYLEFMTNVEFQEDGLKGDVPQTQYMRNQKGEYVALDKQSLEAASLYRTFEDLYDFDRSFGLEKSLKWPRTLVLDVPKEPKALPNALYDPEYDTYMFLRFDRKGLPFSLNPSVVAHEHFHALFSELVLKPLQPYLNQALGMTGNGIRRLNLAAHLQADDSSVEASVEQGVAFKAPSETLQKIYYNLLLMRALNEGMADFWAYCVYGNPNFLKESLVGFDLDRGLDKPVSGLQVWSEDDIKREVQYALFNGSSLNAVGSQLTSAAYRLGTQYARVMRALSVILAEKLNIPEQQSRHMMVTYLVPALRKLPEVIGDGFSKERIRPAQLLTLVIGEIPGMKESSCANKDRRNFTMLDLKRCQAIIEKIPSDRRKKKNRTNLNSKESAGLAPEEIEKSEKRKVEQEENGNVTQ